MTNTTDPKTQPAAIGSMDSKKSSEQSPNKTCRRCGQQKPLDEFGITNRWQSGHLKICRVCESAARRAGRARSQGSEAQTQPTPAPHPQPLSPKDVHDKMFMLIVQGMNREHQILEQCFGKDSPQYKAQMATARMAFEKLFTLLGEQSPSQAVPTDAVASNWSEQRRRQQSGRMKEYWQRKRSTNHHSTNATQPPMTLTETKVHP
jgi:hypothetical protein